MGKRRHKRGRNVNGILILDKPAGMSSNKALQQVKNLLFARKAGHTGSLDPLATGLLAICFGEATKLADYIVDTEKHYRVTGQLGVTTSTGDAEGEIREQKPVPVFDRAGLEAIIETFLGDIMQIPPMYSALKYQGQPLYKLARQGIEVEREPRPVTIFSLDLISISENQFSMDVVCSKGTYIRTLIEDIGAALGCGAHTIALRRTALGPFTEGDMVSMDSLIEAEKNDRNALNSYVKPVETALQDWSVVHLSADAAYYLRQGQAVIASQAPTSGRVSLFDNEKLFMGIGEILDDGRVTPKRLLNINER